MGTHVSDTLETSPMRELLMEAKTTHDTPRLRELADHYNNGVVRLVASNPATPEDVLVALSFHTNASVREHLNNNPSTPLTTVQDLCMDSSPKVVKAAYRRLGITY